MDKPNMAENLSRCQEAQGFMGAVKVVFIQP
jgi:hypothetical protein